MLKNTSRWTIDQERIYVAGISSGGGATANLGATYPDIFAAIGVLWPDAENSRGSEGLMRRMPAVFQPGR